MMDAIGELKRWQKALVLAGGAAAAAGLAWYLLHDDGEEDEEEQEAPPLGAPGASSGLFYRNIDRMGFSIGIRQVPDVRSPKTGLSITPGQVFEVTEVKQVPGEDQAYLQLADGRGWAFTHSGNDGRLLAVPVSPDEAAAGAEPSFSEVERMLMQNPQLMEQMMGSEGMQAMLQNPEVLRMMAQGSPQVAQVLSQNPTVANALNQDPDSLAASLRAASAQAGGAP